MNTNITLGALSPFIQVLNSLCPFPNVKPTRGSPSRLSRQLTGTSGDTTRARASSLSHTATQPPRLYEYPQQLPLEGSGEDSEEAKRLSIKVGNYFEPSFGAFEPPTRV